MFLMQYHKVGSGKKTQVQNEYFIETLKVEQKCSIIIYYQLNAQIGRINNNRMENPPDSARRTHTSSQQWTFLKLRNDIKVCSLLHASNAFSNNCNNNCFFDFLFVTNFSVWALAGVPWPVLVIALNSLVPLNKQSYCSRVGVSLDDRNALDAQMLVHQNYRK